MATNSDFPTCKCGCRENVAGKSVYRPGHDARHVSRLLATADEVFNRTNALTELVQRAKSELPSTALYAKFIRALDKKNPSESGYAENEAEQIEATEYGQRLEDNYGNVATVNRVTGIPDIKVGRWFYPARELHTDLGVETQRNEKRDGTGEWIVAN
ncbi:hypothetical protein [Curtobacterium phage Parvaparticeps]|nr:hypothetical protein [Curtobacterium phage Parvaparticeps]